MKFVSHSPQETQDLAKDIIDKLEDTNIIALYGELGAGKTTFIQGLAKALGVKKRVISPTYILMRKYKLNHALYNSMYHLDLYRVETEADLKSIDLAEIISDPKNLIVIEWAEKAEKTFREQRLDIRFKILGKNIRQIIIRKNY